MELPLVCIDVFLYLIHFVSRCWGGDYHEFLAEKRREGRGSAEYVSRVFLPASFNCVVNLDGCGEKYGALANHRSSLNFLSLSLSLSLSFPE
jgi:hypothetical protein